MREFLTFLIQDIKQSGVIIFIIYISLIIFCKEDRIGFIKVLPYVCLAYFIGMTTIFYTQKWLFVLFN